MAGIYIHIPYCKQACNYCDFHFSTQKNSMEEMQQAMLKELEMRKAFLGKDPVETIYFGGGSPSLLPKTYLEAFLNSIEKMAPGTAEREVTLEANPDDMDLETLMDWRSIGINRLSVGIQSFHDQDLKWMNRAHNADEAKLCIKRAKQAGFENISIDLIYGIPDQDMNTWKENVQLAIASHIQHISAYCLTIEKNTVFGNWKAHNKLSEAPDEKVEEEFLFLRNQLSDSGFEHYEISNFAKAGSISKHNSAYWKGSNYMGIGPSAHSFDGKQRLWNVRNNPQYIRSLGLNELAIEAEVLSEKDRFNEVVLTGLRTIWGVDLDHLQEEFGVDLLEKEKKVIYQFKEELRIEDQHLKLKKKGLLLADRIASDLFWV
ncbi:MAG: radical SAM family heme chaperone HemW [Flavobacteriales bacterium]|nr:radical SAM family heme chaperone HemW [Flavobacteriales bacterium]